MADWGGQETTPFTTPDELNSATMMGKIASEYQSEFVLALGDNFYEFGIQGDEHSKRFKETFENVFVADSLNVPFHVVAGNHDWLGNVSAEIAYSSLSTRWTFPSYYYTYTFNINSNNKKVQILFIDTVLLAGALGDRTFCTELNKREHVSIEDCMSQKLGPQNTKLADDEWNWVNQTLKASTADFLIVVGHYPVWSIAEHGPTWILVDYLRPMLQEYNVNLYMNGHDHTFEYIYDENYSQTGYIGTGGSHVCDSSTSHINDIPANSLKYHGCIGGGFTRVHIEDTLQVYYYDGVNATEQFVTPTFQPRK